MTLSMFIVDIVVDVIVVKFSVRAFILLGVGSVDFEAFAAWCAFLYITTVALFQHGLHECEVVLGDWSTWNCN